MAEKFISTSRRILTKLRPGGMIGPAFVPIQKPDCARGSGGMLPQENFIKFDILRWLLSSFLGLKTSLASRRFSVLAW